MRRYRKGSGDSSSSESHRADEIVREARSRSSGRSSSRNRDRFNVPEVNLPTPDPEEDFRTYERIMESLNPSELRPRYEDMRSDVGRVGFATQNAVAATSKAAIAWELEGDRDLADEYRSKMVTAFNFFKENEDRLPRSGRTNFGNNQAQEVVETLLFVLMWPVVKGDEDEMPPLPSIKDFERRGIHSQATLAGYFDVVSELSKAVQNLTADRSFSPEERLVPQERWLRVSKSARLALANFTGLPNSVVANGFGRRGRSISDGLKWLERLELQNLRHYEQLLNQMQLIKGLERD